MVTNELYAGDLETNFANSAYGQQLAENSRWGDFKPDWVSTGLWTRLLGADVNNLSHMPYTLGLTEDYCLAESLPGAVSQRLGRVAITHDWGEAIVGDISLPSKTEEDEKKEIVAYKKIANELLGRRQGKKLCDDVLPILYKEEAELGDRFRSVEYIGYCTTGIRAARVADAVAYDFIKVPGSKPEIEQLLGGLLALHYQVKTHNFPTLKDYMTKYKGIRTVMGFDV